METKLKELTEAFQSGKHKQAIGELQTFINESPKDIQLYKAHDLLGDFLNYMGQQSEAVQAWTNAIQLLEENEGGIDKLNEGQLIDWINISLGLARVMFRQGCEGSGVSHKHNQVCYSSSKMSDEEETQWKKERIEGSIKHYKHALDKIPESNSETKIKIRTQLAQALFTSGDYDGAVKIYEDVFNNTGDAEWLYQAADCSWKQGKTEQAYVRLQQLIATEPTFAKAYERCATYFTEKNDSDQAEEYRRKYEFYSWVPSFCKHIEYNIENLSMLEILQSDNALECVKTTLADDTSKRSTEFLAAICYHHYHGPVENKAFEILEHRGITFEGDEREFIGLLLMTLLKKQQSVCTIKGAVNALAGMKHNQLFEILVNLLPQDLNVFFPMDIPNAFAKLGDRRAIPLLLNIIEEPVQRQNNDSDSSDDFLTFGLGGQSSLNFKCCLALAPFIDDEKVKECLINGTNKEEISEACLAVLAVTTNEQKYFDELQKILTDGNTLDYRVDGYLQKNAHQRSEIEKLLMLNEDIRAKKEPKINNDDE